MTKKIKTYNRNVMPPAFKRIWLIQLYTDNMNQRQNY